MKHTFFLVVLMVALQLGATEKIKLVILHTNDTHSQIEPTAKSNHRNANMGGVARRIGLIQHIRNTEKNVLLFDAGDFLQGTPYFNFYGGRLEVDALNRMKYDAVTLGNHEFDNGMDSLALILNDAKFPVISSNYNTTNTLIQPFVKPYLVLNRFGLKIGIMALNIQPKGLIFEKNYTGLVYNDPLIVANKMADYLKNKKKCDVVICLSHLGGDADSKDMNDFYIARNTHNIDVIIGGHSHLLLENATQTNLSGNKVIIAQVGRSGLYLGKIELILTKKKKP